MILSLIITLRLVFCLQYDLETMSSFVSLSRRFWKLKLYHLLAHEMLNSSARLLESSLNSWSCLLGPMVSLYIYLSFFDNSPSYLSSPQILSNGKQTLFALWKHFLVSTVYLCSCSFLCLEYYWSLDCLCFSRAKIRPWPTVGFWLKMLILALFLY